MTHRQENLLALAFELYSSGRAQDAIDALCELLGESPDDPTAHALLAMCLVSRKRLHAANLEADNALALAPDNPFALMSAGWVAFAHRRFADAEARMLGALELDPDSAALHRECARYYHLVERHADARRLAEDALQLEGDSPDGLALLGAISLDQGQREAAADLAMRALAGDPEHVDALVLLGRCQLAAGDVDEARDRAFEALSVNPEHEPARGLLCSVKARQNWALGLWWRLQSWLSSGSNTRAIALLVGMYVLYRSVVILLEGSGGEKAAQALQYLWLGFCVYTWIAPGMFLRAVRKEMASVTLRRDF
jgi:tetratricopeptide (TPR) repeat protein